MKLLKKCRYLIGAFLLFGVLAIGEQIHAAPSVSSINGGPIKLIYDYIGHYELNYTGNTNNYDYWNETGTFKLVSKNYKDRTDISTNNNSSATISKTDSKSKIVKAYLIWETRAEAGVTDTIVLITPNGSKLGLSADVSCKDIRTNMAGQEYTAVYTMATDVTSIVCGSNGGYGTYTVANIPVWNGAGSGVACGGESVASWQLVVVEESPNFPLRTISLNLMSQYFFNIDYTIKLDFADASAPSGVVTATFLDGSVDVDMTYRFDGIGYPDDYNYEVDGLYYRYKTQTRGLYKNGVCINDRDTGTVGPGGVNASGGVRVHLFDDKRRTNSAGSQSMIYRWAGTNTGANIFLYGVAIDIFAYDIKFNGNGATAGSMADMPCVYGRGYNLTKNTFTKTGYAFAGWNTKADGSGTSYKNQEYIQNLTSTEKSVTLYAQWEKTGIYNITLNNQSATTRGTDAYYEWYGVGNYTTSSCTTGISKITVPTKTGNVFKGYYTGVNGSGTQYIRADGTITATATTFTKNTTLYAYWEPNIYQITLDNQGAILTGTTAYYEKYGVGNYTTSACTTVITRITNPTKPHYTFKGYYTGINGEGQRIIDENGNIILSSSYKFFTQNTTLYAYWEPVTYTITLDNQVPTRFGDTKFYEKYGSAFYTEHKNIGALNGYQMIEYGYTGGAQYFIAPFDGMYNLLAFGAGGGDCDEMSGTGALTSGSIYLKEGDVLWIYVGGAGSGTTGGYNGGANGGITYSDSNVTYVVQGGGGATDFRKGGTALSNRIMVSSGGGGTLIGRVNDGSYEIVSESGVQESRGEALFDNTYMFYTTYGGGKRIDRQMWMDYYGGGEIGQQILDYQDIRSSMKQGDVFYYDRYKYIIKTLKRGTLGNGTTGGGGGYYGGGYLELLTHGYSSPTTEPTTFSPVGASSGTSYVKGVSSGIIYNVLYNYTYKYGTYRNGDTDTGFAARTGNGVAYISYNDYAYTTEVTPTTSITIPTKEGYRFGGYYTGPNGTGTRYVDESGNILATPTTFTSNTTLYAYWVASNSNSYGIAFNGNGATGGRMSMMNCNFDTNYTLTANAFTKAGYTFTGWNTKPNGTGTSYANMATVRNLSTTKDDVVTLYAQWRIANANYKVNHYIEELNGGWSLHSAETKTGVTNSIVTPASFQKTLTGFTYHHAEVKGLTATSAMVAADGSLVINLYYTRNYYTVTLNKGTGIGSVTGAGTYKYQDNVAIDATVSTGYSWYGWIGTYNTNTKEYKFTMPAANVTMTASTSPIIYKITLDNQGATEFGTLNYYEKYGIGNYSTSGCTAIISKITIPKKTGYVFSGYYTNVNGAGTQYIKPDGTITAASTTFINDTTLYAYWKPITYIIRFEGNGSTGGSMSDFVCTYGDYCQLPLNEFVKKHYAFNCWNTEADGSGTTFVNGSFFENLTEVPNKVITLYAQWTPNKYSIHFDANGGEGYMDDIVLTYDIPQKLPPNAFTRNNGYGDSKFLGWNIIADTREVLYTDGAEVVNATEMDGSTLTFYAIWDDCPWIEADDQYYSLEDAQSGRITYDELISHATASDREEGDNIPSGVDEETGTAFWIADYQPTDFTIFTSDGSVTETFQVVDRVGNTYKQTITVYIVDTEPKVIKPVGTTRFIDEKYYYETFENGGLEENSIWKTDPEYVSVITQAFENSRNNTPIMSFYFEYEDILAMKQFVHENGIGNSVHEDALERFYVQFMEPNTVN